MQTLLTYLWAMVVSLLPHRYRTRLSIHGSRELWLGTVLCGSAQLVFFTFLLLAMFMSQITDKMGSAGTAVLQTQTGPSMDVMQVQLATGVLGLANFALNPLNLLVFYFILEGASRALGALTAGEICGTAPLYLVSACHTAFDKAKTRLKLGPLVIDEIRSPDYDTCDLEVLSCRPKPDWTRYITVRFRNEFYVVAGSETVEGPRPFLYRLRKNPTGRLVLVIREYELDDPIAGNSGTSP